MKRVIVEPQLSVHVRSVQFSQIAYFHTLVAWLLVSP